MKRLALPALLLLLTGCANPFADRPTPTVTVTSDAENTNMLALRLAWADTSPSDQEGICDTFREAPEYAWSMMHEGTADTLDRATFFQFFGGVC